MNYFKQSMANVVNRGGQWHDFALWVPEKKSWMPVKIRGKSGPQIVKILERLLAPLIPGTEVEYKRIAESLVKLTKKDIKDIVRSLL